MRKSTSNSLLILGLFLVLLFLLNISTGSVNISISEIIASLLGYSKDSIGSQIVWDFRLPKAATCILAGAGLGAGGLMMQTFFRNPLAGPDVLGLSSGASLMVAITILAQSALPFWASGINQWAVAIASSGGASLVFFIVIAAAQKLKDNSSLLIIGMMVAAFASSLVSVMQFLSKAEDLQAFMIWTLGSAGATSWREIQIMTVIVFIGLAISSICVKALNSWFMGEQYSKSIGVNIKRARFWIVFSTCLMVGSITAFCGPIAFVGLAVPHLVKLLIPTNNHKILLPAVSLGGSILLLACDTLAQLPGSTQILPLNAVTSFIGAPVLIWVVLRNKRKFLNSR